MDRAAGPVELEYRREHDVVHLRLGSMTNHELRTVLLALWATLDRDDQADMIRELGHYYRDPTARLPDVARAIIVAYREGQRT